jgi:tRNA A-37 threonylcarbamoyl transferase component Bud32
MNFFTCTNLIAMGRYIPTPFHLSIAKDQGEIELKIETILRIVPGKRLVAVTRWKDELVILKLFFQPGHWKRNLLKDIKGVNLLRQSSIQTPDIIHQTTTTDIAAGVLIIDYLQRGASLAAVFDKASTDAEQLDILQTAIRIIAECHRVGVWQKDIHLDNFMMSDGCIYLLDGGEIESTMDALDERTRMKNLAMFFAQFAIATDRHLEQAVEHYQNNSDLSAQLDIASLKEKITDARVTRLEHYERKLYRSTTANRCVQNGNRFVIYNRSIHSEEIESFINKPNEYIDEGQLVKKGNTSTVASVRINNKEFMLKRYNIKGFWHGLKRSLQPSRAHHSWRNASMLEMLGLATPHAFLFMEERFLWVFRSRAYILYEKIEGNTVLEQLQDSAESPEAEKILQEFTDVFQIMEKYQINHGDMKASNFIYSRDKLYMLDLDAMQRHRSRQKFMVLFSRDMVRFRKNWIGSKLEPLVNRLFVDIDTSSSG